MRLALAIILQLTALGGAYIGTPVATVVAGMCAMAVIALRARFSIREG
jgi:hypothetical protein